jgi:hypothetical protein
METKPMPEELPARWRERAEYLRQYGDSNTARLWTLAADELEAALKTSGEEPLTLGQAAKLSGLTPDYIGELIRTGKLKNYGREGAPRVRRADLPTKGSRGRPQKAESPSTERERQLVRDVAKSFATKQR